MLDFEILDEQDPRPQTGPWTLGQDPRLWTSNRTPVPVHHFAVCIALNFCLSFNNQFEIKMTNKKKKKLDKKLEKTPIKEFEKSQGSKIGKLEI